MYYDVTSVKPMEGYHLDLSFEDGKRGTFDMSKYLSLPAFKPLRAKALFSRAFVDEGTVAWPGDIDIAPEHLWSKCVVK